MMLRHIAQRLIETFFNKQSFLSLILKVGMFTLETLDHMPRDLWTAGSLVPFSYGSKVPSAINFTIRVITKKVYGIGSQRLAVFKLFPWPYHIFKISFEKSCLSFAKTKKSRHQNFTFFLQNQN